MKSRLDNYLSKNNLNLIEKISKGWSSEVYLVENFKHKKFAIKIEKEKSPRKDFVKKEVENLKLANSAGMGPKLFDFSEENRCILMEFIEGQTFNKVLESNPSKKKLEKIKNELYRQAKKLDEIGLDHGQLSGGLKNIIVNNKKVVIIDFEKASTKRKVHNKNVLDSIFERNKDGEVTKKILKILEKQKA